MPPESAKRPFGAVTLAWLPLMVELMTVSPASSLAIPAPSASLATAPSPVAEPMRLSLTVVFASVSVPQLSMPPPAAVAAGQRTPPGQGGPTGRAWVGSARLPVMTLLEIVTVAPPLKSAFGGISTPPPRAITPSSPVRGADSGLDRATPPVMVTPEIETVGSVDAPKTPIVSTEPPPRSTVEPAPAPVIFTLTSIVTPPAYVPGAMVIVSPLRAAPTAACKVAKQPGWLPTHRLAATAGRANSTGNTPTSEIVTTAEAKRVITGLRIICPP